jgi:hypothetical protein
LFLLVRQILDHSPTKIIPKPIHRLKWLRILTLKNVGGIFFLTAISLSEFFGPQTIPIVTVGYPSERDDSNQSFNWRGLVSELRIDHERILEAQCISIPLKSPLNSGRYAVNFTRIKRETLESFASGNLTYAKARLSTGQEKILEFSPDGPPWQRLCACLGQTTNDAVPVMYIQNGDIISFSKLRPNQDPRFIALGVGSITSLPPDHDTANCSRI